MSEKNSEKSKAPGPSKRSDRVLAEKPKAATRQKFVVGTRTETSYPVLEAGNPAPEFNLPRDGGGLVSLSDYRGRKLAIFFYPRADTPGCTREAVDFSRLTSQFEQLQVHVIGVSADRLKSQESFRTKHGLTMPLLSDEGHEMLEAYGVWGQKSMYGRTFLGIVRTTVLIGANGTIARIWRNVKVDGHADEVLTAARLL